MKMTKRVLALVLCLMMVLSLSVSAFAAGENHTITINNSVEDYEYEAYQIFAGELGTDGVLSNVSWGSGVDGAALLAELKTLPAYATCTDAKQVAAELAKNGAMDDPDAIAFAEIAARHLTSVCETSTFASGKYTIDGLDDGYYLVVNTKVPNGADDHNSVYSRYILEVVRNVSVAHKGDFPHVDKKIVEGSDKVTTNEASIGEKVHFEITGTMPDNIGYYDTYYYVFTDTLSKGLTFDRNPADPTSYTPDTMNVTVNGVDVTDYFHISATAYDAVNGTTITVGIQDLLALEQLDDPHVGTITKDTEVVITYTAELNENAVIASTGNPNEVDLEYSNNPNEDGEGATLPPPPNPDKPTPEYPTGKTPKKETVTYTTQLAIQKVDGAGNDLTGAEFTLTGDSVITTIVTHGEYQEVTSGGTHWLLKDGTYTDEAPVFVDDTATPDKDERTADHYDPRYTESDCDADFKLVTVTKAIEKTESVAVKGYVDANGELVFSGLGAGTYTLTETVTPNGFNTIEPIVFTIKFDRETAAFSAPDNNWIMNSIETPNTLYAEIVNVAGTTLPSTGGIGTTLFYVFGSLLFGCAVVLLITKKRMAN